MFFPRATIILFQVAKKIEKRNGEMVLYFYFVFRQAVDIKLWAVSTFRLSARIFYFRVTGGVFVRSKGIKLFKTSLQTF